MAGVSKRALLLWVLAGASLLLMFFSICYFEVMGVNVYDTNALVCLEFWIGILGVLVCAIVAIIYEQLDLCLVTVRLAACGWVLITLAPSWNALEFKLLSACSSMLVYYLVVRHRFSRKEATALPEAIACYRSHP